MDPLASKYPEWSSYNYTLNNPIRYIDQNGDSVYANYIWTAPLAYHVFISASDENGKERNIAEGMPTNRESGIITGSSQTLINGLTGLASSAFFGVEAWGNLEKQKPNNPDQISRDNKESILIPQGMTEKEFVDGIINAYNSYDNKVPYAPMPIEGVTGNSNSIVGSVLRASSSKFQPKVWAPGWGINVLPSQRKK